MNEEFSLLDRFIYALQDTTQWIIDNPFLALLILLLLLLLLLILASYRSASSNDSDSGSGSGDEEDGSIAEYQRALDAQKALEEAQKQTAISEFALDEQSSDSETREIAKRGFKNLQKQAGMAHLPLREILLDPKLLAKLAASVNLNDILGYSLAKHISLPDIKASQSSERQPAMFATLDPDIVYTDDPTQIFNASPEDLCDTDAAFEKLRNGELPVTVYYETKVTLATLLLLVDVSQSMDDTLSNGYKKYVVARAILQKLLARAVLGEARYLLRFFDGSVHKLHKAMTAEEADNLSRTIANQNFSGGGTDISNALHTGIEDITSSTDFEITSAEILLISDGEDGSLPSAAEIQADLGSIKLHLAIVGKSSNPSLEQVATSKQYFN